MNNNSYLEDPTRDKSLFEKDANRDWRAPTASEAELILAWKREVLRAGRPLLYFLGVSLVVPIFLIVLSMTGIWGSILFLTVALVELLFTIQIMFIVSGVYRLRQIRRGEYQIIDSVAITTLLKPSGKFLVQVMTSSDELLDVEISENASKTITSNKPGFLLRYGKNAGSHKAKPSEFIPINESVGPAESLTNQSSDSEWRTPNASETERIAAWMRKIYRANRPINIVGLALLPFLLIAMLVLVLTGQSTFDKFWPYALGGVGVEIFLVRLQLAASQETKQIVSGDYQILDAVVVSKNSPIGGRKSDYFLQARTPSGMMINERVGKQIYKAVTENEPGFLVRVNDQRPKKNKGAGLSFFPAKSVNE